MATSEPIVDWRGTVITEGATVIYGGPVGRSIQQVEGRVAGFTKTGRVNVEIIRRSYTTPYGGGDKRVVHVGPDRLTIVESLPPTDKPTWGELGDAADARRAEQTRIRDTHDLETIDITEGPLRGMHKTQCKRCGRDYGTAYREVCDVNE